LGIGKEEHIGSGQPLRKIAVGDRGKHPNPGGQGAATAASQEHDLPWQVGQEARIDAFVDPPREQEEGPVVADCCQAFGGIALSWTTVGRKVFDIHAMIEDGLGAPEVLSPKCVGAHQQPVRSTQEKPLPFPKHSTRVARPQGEVVDPVIEGGALSEPPDESRSRWKRGDENRVTHPDRLHLSADCSSEQDIVASVA